MAAPQWPLLMGAAGVNLLLLTVCCCLCPLVPGARADWETLHCDTAADSIPVATALSILDRFIAHSSTESWCCIDGTTETCEAFEGQQQDGRYYNFGTCGPVTHCDNCRWVAKMWRQVVNKCRVNFGDGVDRVGGYIGYDWSPGIWMHYRIWKA